MSDGTAALTLGVGVLALVSTSVLVYFGTGLHPWWPLLWFAPLPALVFALYSSSRGAALIAGVGWFVGMTNLWHYFRVLQTPPAVWIGFALISALVFACAVLLFRGLLLRGFIWMGMLSFPAAWVAYEYIRNLATPHGTAGSIAYSQLDFLPFLQFASIAGPWGMVFILFLVPASIAAGIYLRRSAPKQGWRIPAAALAVTAAILLYGAIRLVEPQPAARVRVGLIASDARGNRGIAEGAAADRLIGDYAREAERLSAAGARAIVIPEKLAVLSAGDGQGIDSVLQSVADRTGSVIVAGIDRRAGGRAYNQGRTYSPGAPILEYSKRHLLPPFESMFTPGSSIVLMQAPSGKRGVAVCKDLDFTPLAREYGNAGAGLLLVPAWDFDLDRWWHGHIAVMRGVENGFSVARAARQGYLTVSDNRGRILAEVQSDSAPFASLVADVPVEHETTLYTRFGDWFAWVALLVLLWALAQLRFRPRVPTDLA